MATRRTRTPGKTQEPEKQTEGAEATQEPEKQTEGAEAASGRPHLTDAGWEV